MSEIKFRMAAKTDVGLERSNNEDNFQVAANLEESPMRWINNHEYTLGRKGALMVVADGMGGMNAGEVASDIAINTVRELFAPEKITDDIVKTRFTIEKFMKSVVIEADRRIKEYAKVHPESKGMGTTIVIGWLFDGHLYVTWCGDSRAYIFNSNTGLFQISKDHSYVQQLVDCGKISKEDAFDFPDSNIITRSLSDATPKAVPDCLLKPQPLCNGDIILLCSDGLNGMIRDYEIESVIAQHQDNMTTCVDELIRSALDAAGADNCTVALCQIISGGGQSEQSRIPKFNSKFNFTDTLNTPMSYTKKKTSLWVSLIALFLIIMSCIAIFVIKGNPFAKPNEPVEEQVTDTIPQQESVDCTESNDDGQEDFTENNESESKETDKDIHNEDPVSNSTSRHSGRNKDKDGAKSTGKSEEKPQDENTKLVHNGVGLNELPGSAPKSEGE